MPTASPVTSRWRASVAVATTSPVSKPIRTSSPIPCSLDELRVQGGDPRTDVERRAGGAQRVVLVRDGSSESRHHRVAGELLDRAPVPSEHGGDGLEVALKHPAERLRVERLRERHRLDDVDEEDRREPAELHRGLDRRCLGQEQRLVLAQDRGLERLELRAGSIPSSSTSVSRAAR